MDAPKKKAGRKVPVNPIGYNCVNVLVQRAIAKVVRRINSDRRRNAWNDANRDRVSATSAALYQKKRTQRIQETTDYRIQNKPAIRKAQRIRESTLYHSDDAYRTGKLLRGRLLNALKSSSDTKMAHTVDLLGAQVEDVQKHIDEQWNDPHNAYEDIDHIFPFAMHDTSSEYGQRKVMHYSNLQPLTASENRSKWTRMPTKAMAAKVERWAWPPGVTEDMLPDIYEGWSTALRM
jgi:5-methylcytosine-specific restriction endonuclease McrA